MAETETHAAPPEADASPADAAAAEAMAALKAGRFDAAVAAAEAALGHDADHRDALYAAAVAHRYAGRAQAAEAMLERLRLAHPDYGRGFQELGHLKRAAGALADARSAYEDAVRRNPALTASWAALAELKAAEGDPEAAARARAQAERLAALPPELVSINSFIHENRLYKAERLARAFLKRHPRDVEAMRLLALIGLKLNVLDDAEFLLESALAFEPDYLIARVDYVHALTKRQKFQRAYEEAGVVRMAEPDNPVFLSLLANAAVQIGRHDEALDLYSRVLRIEPGNPFVHLSRGHALKTVGRTDEAITDYRAAAQARPELGDAWWSLANLKTYRFSDAELERMRALEAGGGLTPEDRVHLRFALGKALEDREAYAESFGFYESGNALKKAELRYSADRMDAEFARQKAACTPALFAEKAGLGHDAPDPIFIVGLPRAGSTLIEQILASHSQVDGTLELPNILAIAHKLSGRRRVDEAPLYPANLAELDAETLRELGRAYIEETRVHRRGAPFFTDKMPNNFRHLGLIKLILPNARIIDARREAMACCFSGFKQLFAEGQEFTYGLEEIGRYYRGYVDLMDHWDAVMPGAVLRVRYEDVVEDLEGQVRRMLDHLGLPFEPACVEFHKTRREVRTASSEQVRQPLFRSGVEQWRRYEPWLDPLKAALGPALAG